ESCTACAAHATPANPHKNTVNPKKAFLRMQPPLAIGHFSTFCDFGQHRHFECSCLCGANGGRSRFQFWMSVVPPYPRALTWLIRLSNVGMSNVPCHMYL